MILWSGGQYEHCIQTIGFAIQEFADIKGRMLELRASCHMALRNFKVTIGEGRGWFFFLVFLATMDSPTQNTSSHSFLSINSN
jgi:hypothetical protein